MPPAEIDGPTLMMMRSQDPGHLSGRVTSDIGETTLSSEGLPEPLRAFLLERGDTLGRYVVLDVLGQGGMGVVYAAYDPELDRKVAIKLVRWAGPSDGKGSLGGSRLLREAQALAKLTHPNVVAVHDVGTWQQQSVFVAMDLVEGRTVAHWIEQRHSESPPRWREVLDVMIPAGRGLEAAHAVGIVHRDFKPENVMLSTSGRVTVLDFGLARATEDPGSELRLHSSGVLAAMSSAVIGPLTVTGSVMGTPAYMAPEQLAGRLTDASSDQFSYCVALYHALYGVRPFAGSTLTDLTRAVLRGSIEPAPRGSRVPAWLRRVVVRGLATDPVQRYASMTELLAALSHDPARRRGRVLLGVGVVGLLGASWWGATRVAEGDDPCAAIDGMMADAWAPAQRAALEAAFRRDAKAYSEQTLTSVGESLDGWAARWVEERHVACEADRAEGGRDAGLRAACLDERLGRFDALVRLLGDADQEMVARALTAVQALPEPSECRDALGWRQSSPVPDDPGERQAVVALRLRMAEVFALSTTGRIQDSVALADSLLGEGRALGFGPVIAQMLLVVGGSRTQLGDYAGALPVLEEGLLLARTHGLEQLEADLLSPTTFLHTVYTGRLELAEWHARVHEVLVERLGNEPHAKARVLLDRARLARQRERTHEAIALYEQAIALYEQDGSDAPSLVVAYDNLAAAYVVEERYADADAVLERAQVVAANVLGFDHPHRGNLMVQASRIASARGDHAGTVTKLQAALALYEGAYGGQHANIAAVLNGLGLELEAIGEPEQAIAAFERGVEVSRRTLGPEHRQVGVVQANLGNTLRREGRAQEALELHQAVRELRERIEVPADDRYHLLENLADDLRALGRCEEAEAEYRAALAVRETAGENDGFEAAYGQLGIGLCQRRRGQHAAARATLEAALRHVAGQAEPKGDWSQRVLSLVRFGLAIALREQDAGSERAGGLAGQARAFWAKNPLENAGLLRQYDAWVAGEPVGMLVY
jgi:tetratricopeptide (TPR) repeat protein